MRRRGRKKERQTEKKKEREKEGEKEGEREGEKEGEREGEKEGVSGTGDRGAMAAVNKSKKLYLCGAPGLGRPNLVRGRASAGERVMVIRAQSRVENGNHHKGRNSSAAHCSKSGGYTAEASLVDNLIRINDSLKKENEALRIALSKIDKAELTRVLEKVETTKTTMTYPRTAMASSIPGTIFDEKERRNALKHKTRRRKKKELSAAYFKVDLDKIKWPSPSDSPPFWERTYPKANGEHVDTMADELNYTETMANGTVHTVIHVTAEMAPLAKVGGLGDAVAGLARSCLFAGHNVEVVLPFYESIVRHEHTLVETCGLLSCKFFIAVF